MTFQVLVGVLPGLSAGESSDSGQGEQPCRFLAKVGLLVDDSGLMTTGERKNLPDQQRFEAKITWPADVYGDAQLANFFVVTDDGTGVYIAFGYIPPFPGPPPESLETVTPRIQSAVFINHANAKQLAEVLDKVPTLRTQQQSKGAEQ